MSSNDEKKNQDADDSGDKKHVPLFPEHSVYDLEPIVIPESMRLGLPASDNEDGNSAGDKGSTVKQTGELPRRPPVPPYTESGQNTPVKPPPPPKANWSRSINPLKGGKHVIKPQSKAEERAQSKAQETVKTPPGQSKTDTPKASKQEQPAQAQEQSQSPTQDAKVQSLPQAQEASQATQTNETLDELEQLVQLESYACHISPEHIFTFEEMPDRRTDPAVQSQELEQFIQLKSFAPAADVELMLVAEMAADVETIEPTPSAEQAQSAQQAEPAEHEAEAKPKEVETADASPALPTAEPAQAESESTASEQDALPTVQELQSLIDAEVSAKQAARAEIEDKAEAVEDGEVAAEPTEPEQREETEAEVKPAEAVEEAKPAEAVEETKPVQTAEEVKPAEVAEEAKPAEAVEEAKPAEAAEEAKPVEAAVETKPVEVAEEVKPAEAVEEAKPVQTAEEAKPVQTAEEAKPVETAEEAKPAEPAEEAKPVETAEQSAPVVEAADAPEKADEQLSLPDLIPPHKPIPSPWKPVPITPKKISVQPSDASKAVFKLIQEKAPEAPAVAQDEKKQTAAQSSGESAREPWELTPEEISFLQDPVQEDLETGFQPPPSAETSLHTDTILEVKPVAQESAHVSSAPPPPPVPGPSIHPSMVPNTVSEPKFVWLPSEPPDLTVSGTWANMDALGGPLAEPLILDERNEQSSRPGGKSFAPFEPYAPPAAPEAQVVQPAAEGGSSTAKELEDTGDHPLFAQITISHSNLRPISDSVFAEPPSLHQSADEAERPDATEPVESPLVQAHQAEAASIGTATIQEQSSQGEESDEIDEELKGTNSIYELEPITLEDIRLFRREDELDKLDESWFGTKDEQSKAEPTAAQPPAMSPAESPVQQSAPAEEEQQEDVLLPEQSIYDLEPFVLPERLHDDSQAELATISIPPPAPPAVPTQTPSAPQSPPLPNSQSGTDAWVPQQSPAPWGSMLPGQPPAPPPPPPPAHLAVSAAPDMVSETLHRSILPTSQGMDPFIGSVLANKYEILDVMGAGGMAVVYRARRISDNHLVAIKTLKTLEPIDLMRFSQEIKTHSQLDHKNIVGFIEAVANEGQLFLVMERVKGISLQELIKVVKRLDKEENIADILLQILTALDYAHENGVIHRDLKTGNIILIKEVDENMVVKLLDFGIAKVDRDGEEQQRLTHVGQALGSPIYMSPEQCTGRTLTTRSDLYSLGVVAYEMVTGAPPYCKGTLINIMSAHCNENIRPAPIMDKAPHLRGVKLLNQIIQKALETQPERRWQSAARFRAAVQFWIAAVQAGNPPEELPPELLAGGLHPRIQETFESSSVESALEQHSADVSRYENQLQEERSNDRKPAEIRQTLITEGRPKTGSVPKFDDGGRAEDTPPAEPGRSADVAGATLANADGLGAILQQKDGPVSPLIEARRDRIKRTRTMDGKSRPTRMTRSEIDELDSIGGTNQPLSAPRSFGARQQSGGSVDNPTRQSDGDAESDELYLQRTVLLRSKQTPARGPSNPGNMRRNIIIGLILLVVSIAVVVLYFASTAGDIMKGAPAPATSPGQQKTGAAEDQHEDQHEGRRGDASVR